MGRPKKAGAILETLDQANAAMRSLLLAEVELEKYQGASDLARAEATSRFEKKIGEGKAEVADLKLQLQTFYNLHKPEGKKSIELSCGTIGSRLDPPSLRPLNRSWTWAAIGVKLRLEYPGKYFRAVDPEIDKDLVKAELSDAQMKVCGLKVEQEDKFYAETDRAQLGAAARA